MVLNLTDADQAVTLSWAGFRLRALGRLREAAQPMQAALENHIKQKNWRDSALDAGNLSELYLTLGEVNEAVRYARQSVDFADRSEDHFEQWSDRVVLADSLHMAGDLSEAESVFIQAEKILKKKQPEYKYLYSGGGARFCDLLLDQGQAQEVLERAKQALEWANKAKEASLLDFALNKLSLGRAYLMQALSLRGSAERRRRSNLQPQRGLHSKEYLRLRFARNDEALKKAADYLNQAVTGLREAGTQDHLPRGLFARAFYYRIQHQFAQAWDDLEEAREIAERGEMGLWLVDYHLEASRLLISEFGIRNGTPTAAVEKFHEISLRRETFVRDETFVRGESPLPYKSSIQRVNDHLKQAAELVQKTGYHRRDPEVELGYAALYLAQGDSGRARERLASGKKLLDKVGIRCWDFEVRRLEEGIG